MHEEEAFADPLQTATLVLSSFLFLLLELVHEDAVAVNGGAKDQVGSFILDLNVPITFSLTESVRESDTEHGFPRVFAGEVGIKLIRKFQAISSGAELRVVVKVSAGVGGDVAECLKIFIEFFLAPAY